MKEPQPPASRSIRLLRIVLLVLGGQILVLLALALLLARDRSSSAVLAHTVDFEYFYRGARAWLSGQDPYQVQGFITPPPSLIWPSLFTLLPVSAGKALFSLGNLAVVFLALWWYAGALRLPGRERALLLLAALIFLPTLQSVFGGNLDSLMLALLMAAFAVHRRVRGAFWLAASIVVKLYSVILLPVALRRRQWGFVALTLLAVLLLLLPFHALWPSAFHALTSRSVRYAETSISPATLLYVLFGAGHPTAHSLCLAFWLTTFAVALVRDRQRSLGPSALARYAPWILGYPPLVFPYVGILAVPVLAGLLAVSRRRPLQWAEHCVLVGFLLLGIHAEQVTNAIPLGQQAYLFFRLHAPVIQSCGVTLMMIGASLSPCGESPEEEAPHEAFEEIALAGHPLPDRSR